MSPDDQQLVETAEEIASSLSHMKFGPHIVTALRFSAEAIRRLSGEVEELKDRLKHSENGLVEARSDRRQAMQNCEEAWAHDEEQTERCATAELQLSQARELLEAHTAWEADLILNGDWSNEMPRLKQEQYDGMMELQAKRNTFLNTTPEPEKSDG